MPRTKKLRTFVYDCTGKKLLSSSSNLIRRLYLCKNQFSIYFLEFICVILTACDCAIVAFYMNHIVGGRLKDFLQVICSRYLLEIKIKDIFVMWETDIFSCIHHIGDKGNRLFTLLCLSHDILYSPCVIPIQHL